MHCVGKILFLMLILHFSVCVLAFACFCVVSKLNRTCTRRKSFQIQFRSANENKIKSNGENILNMHWVSRHLDILLLSLQLPPSSQCDKINWMDMKRGKKKNNNKKTTENNVSYWRSLNYLLLFLWSSLHQLLFFGFSLS